MSVPATWTDALLRRRPLSALGGVAAPSLADPATGGSGGALVEPSPALVHRSAAASLDARDFGAIGDGVADDTDAIEAALAALPRPRLDGGVYVGGGGVLTLPAGTYRIRRTLQLSDNQTLRGAGGAPNTTANQGATLLDASEVEVAVRASGAAHVAVESLAIKGCTGAGVELSAVHHGAIRGVSVFGTGVVRTGLHLRDGTLFTTVEDCNVNGLVGVLGTGGEDLCVGLLIEGESNEITVQRGNIRQNATNIRVIDCNGVLVLGVNCEGGAATLGVHVVGSELTCIRARFEGVGRAVLIEASARSESVFAGFSNGYHPNTGVGLQVESAGALLALVEPMLHRCPTPVSGAASALVAPYTLHDPGRRGLRVGSLRLNGHDESGVNGILSGSGRLVLEIPGGNPLELRMSAGIVQWLAYYGAPNAPDNALRSLLDIAPLGSIYSRLDGAPGSARLWVRTEPEVWTPVDVASAAPAEAPAEAPTEAPRTAGPDEAINPRLAPYNAVGDGNADDTDALQAALDAVSARLARGLGARMVLPEGSYLVRRPLSLQAQGGAGWSLRGEPGTSVVYAGAAGEALLTIANGCRYTVEDIDMNGQGLVRSVVELTGTGGPGRFARCRFFGVQDQAGSAAVALFRPDGEDGYQQDLRFEQCTLWAGSPSADGFRARFTNGGRFVFDGCTFRENGTGVALIHNLGVALRSCEFTGWGAAITAHDTQLVVEGCTFYTPKLLWQSMGSATLSGCTWVPGSLPDDGQIIWCDGRLALIGCELLNQRYVGGPRQYIDIGQHASVFSRGSRYTDAATVPLRYYGQVLGGPDATDDLFKANQRWDWGRGPAIDVAGDIGVSYTGDWTAMPSMVRPTPRLHADSLAVQADQVSAGHQVLSEGQLTRQVARFRVPASVWTAAAAEQIHVLARPFHRTRVVAAWIDVTTALAGVGSPQLSLGLEGLGDCDTLLRAAPADAVGLIGASIQDLGRGLDPETAVQGGCLVGWTPGGQERLALRLTAAEALGDGAATRLTAGQADVIVMFEVLP